uniref:hypothetical protein n=1 Tax=Actinoplanes sp. CA-084688 TaxID=3239901 RepID=UPI003F491CA1
MAVMQRYRILHAILALREFTVADLARYSGVKDTTVRTVLGRETRFVQREGIRSPGGRGGQPIQYRLRADAEPDLVAILRELESVGASRQPLVEDQEDPVLLSLIAAEDVLLRQVPQAATAADCAKLVELATADYQAVHLVAKAREGAEAATHCQIVDLLLRLTEIEQEVLALDWPTPGTITFGQPAPAAATLGAESEKKLRELGRKWRSLLVSWPALSDRELLPDLVYRLGTSLIGSAVLASAGAADTGDVTCEATSPEDFYLCSSAPRSPLLHPWAAAYLKPASPAVDESS